MRLSKEQRKAQILDVATRIFVEKGYYDTKTKDIAQACGVTEPVIYKHFTGKDDLFYQVLERIAGATLEEVNFNPALDTEQILISFVMNRVKILEDNFPLFKKLLIVVLRDDEFRQYYFTKFIPKLAYPVIGYLDQLKEQGVIKKDVPSSVIALALAGIFVQVSLAKGFEKDQSFYDFPTNDLVTQMLDIYLHGLLKGESGG
jgi:AcrR family transcriptional regulator